MGKTRAKASNFGGSFPAIVLVSGRYLATVRFCQQGRRSQSRSSDVDFGDKMDLVQAFRIQRRLGKHPIFKGLFLMFLSIPLLSPCRLANRGSLKISRLQVGTVFHLFHCPQLCRFSPPASPRWVCLAGAGRRLPQAHQFWRGGLYFCPRLRQVSSEKPMAHSPT